MPFVEEVSRPRQIRGRHWTSDRWSSLWTIGCQRSMGLSHTEFLLRSVDRFCARSQIYAEWVVSDGTICKNLDEYCDQHKFPNMVRYLETCKVTYMSGVSVNFPLTLWVEESLIESWTLPLEGQTFRWEGSWIFFTIQTHLSRTTWD